MWGRRKSRWPDWEVRQVSDREWHQYTSPEGQAAWERDEAAFLASHHIEPRPGEPPTYHRPAGLWPAAMPGERVARTYAYHRLFEVTKPRRAGYRVVGLVNDGVASVWELPGWNYEDAQLFAVNFEDGYL